jgi:hypothetical protein
MEFTLEEVGDVMKVLGKSQQKDLIPIPLKRWSHFFDARLVIYSFGIGKKS